MANQSIHTFRSAAEMAGFLLPALNKLQKTQPSKPAISVALSGGSTPKAIYQQIIRDESSIRWDKILFFWGDERCVHPTDKESNFNMTQENLFKHLPVPQTNTFRIRGEEDPKKEAARYSSVVSSMLSGDHSIPRFDMVMLGLGEDGHTASLFPGDDNALSSHDLFLEVVHPTTRQNRITATLNIINNARTVVFLVTGKAKAAMATRIIEKTPGWEKFPAAHVNPVQGELYWLLDHDAASGLTI